MKNKIKILLLLLFVILLSGCSGEYNLKINKDYSVNENVKLAIEKKEDTYEKALKLFEKNKIDDDKYEVYVTGNKVNIEYSESYTSFEDYILNSVLYKQLFSNIQYSKNDDYLIVYTSSNLKLNDKEGLLNNSSYIEKLKINVTSPFSISKNNADKSTKDTMTWILKKNDTKKEIFFKYNYLKNSNFSYIVIILIIIILFSSILILVKKFLNNKDKH